MVLLYIYNKDASFLFKERFFESKIRYKKWCYFGAAKLLIFNTLIYEIVL